MKTSIFPIIGKSSKPQRQLRCGIALRVARATYFSNDWKTADSVELFGTGPLDAEFESVTNRIDTAGKTNEFIRLSIELN